MTSRKETGVDSKHVHGAQTDKGKGKARGKGKGKGGAASFPPCKWCKAANRHSDQCFFRKDKNGNLVVQQGKNNNNNNNNKNNNNGGKPNNNNNNNYLLEWQAEPSALGVE